MKFLCCSLFGIIVLELLVFTLANPDGFININCGALKNETGGDDLLWVSDSPYTRVQSRKNSTLLNGLDYLPYRSISYFTDLSQKKYCYLLPVQPDIHYLVRTRFHYAGFKSLLPLASVFDLFVQGVKFATVNLPNYYKFVPLREIILASKSDKLSLCLARNSKTQPGSYVFISTIEMRQLDSSMYRMENNDFQKSALVKINRTNFGGGDIFYREDKSDRYDRIWYSYERDIDHLNTTAYLATKLPNYVPQKVLQTAVSANGSENMDISDAFRDYDDSFTPRSYYFLFYFCNIKLPATSGTINTFKVQINDQESDWVVFKDYLECRHLDQYLDLGTKDTDINVILRPQNYSTAFGPFINGAELYKILDVQNTDHEDVLAIWELAKAINVPDDWSGADPCLPLGYSSTGITCSNDNPPRVIIINLANMGLVGSIPPSIAKLTALTELLLENNTLSGPLPDLSQLKSLTKLYLQNNSLTGSLPRGLLKHGLDLRVDPQIKLPAHKTKILPIGISIGCSMLLVLVVITTAFIWRHRHRSQPYTEDCSTSKANNSIADVEDQSEYRRLAIEYTEDEIKAATNDYSRVLGKGSFGYVFHGTISGFDVAVKVLSTDSNQGKLEFHNELTVLSRIHHKNLVNLVGYCRRHVVALVYEFMECGSLKDHLYGVAKLEKPLDWPTRLNIALQVAEGLLYLHHWCNPPIIHRDIKSNNILLDGNMFAKVADFGLSKRVESSKSYVSTNVKGTLGYLDPQYYETSALTEKSDVYSFGVVLLEIISGISPRDGIVESGRKFVACGRLVDLIDPSLGGRHNLASASKIANIAYACTEPKSTDRPQMTVVVKELQDATALPEEQVNHTSYSS